MPHLQPRRRISAPGSASRDAVRRVVVHGFRSVVGSRRLAIAQLAATDPPQTVARGIEMVDATVPANVVTAPVGAAAATGPMRSTEVQALVVTPPKASLRMATWAILNVGNDPVMTAWLTILGAAAAVPVLRIGRSAGPSVSSDT